MSELENISVLVLAGGFGTRLNSIVADRPKVLAEVAGRPFLTYLLDQLCDAGLRSVVLCTGFRAEAVTQSMGACYRSLSIRHCLEKEPLGTGGAIRHASHQITTYPVLVMNGDSYCEIDFGAFVRWHQVQKAVASLVLTKVPDVSRYGEVKLNSDCVISEFSEKGQMSRPGWINGGIYLFEKEIISSFPTTSPLSLEREVLPMWTSRKMFGYRTTGRFIDIGTPVSYAKANEIFAMDYVR